MYRKLRRRISHAASYNKCLLYFLTSTALLETIFHYEKYKHIMTDWWNSSIFVKTKWVKLKVMSVNRLESVQV